MGLTSTVEPLYNEILGTMKFTLLYQVSRYIRVKKQTNIKSWDQQNDLVIRGFCYTVEPHYNEVLGTMKISLLYQVSHYIRVKKQRSIKNWDQQNYLVIRGFCYIRPLYNEVPLICFYCSQDIVWVQLMYDLGGALILRLFKISMLKMIMI